MMDKLADWLYQFIDWAGPGLREWGKPMAVAIMAFMAAGLVVIVVTEIQHWRKTRRRGYR